MEHPSSARHPEKLRAFTKYLIRDTKALEQMLADDMFERDTKRIGAEQELFIIDRASRPYSLNTKLIEELDDPHFAYELARFNLEFNLDPLSFGGKCLRNLEQELNKLIGKARQVAEKHEGDIILMGSLSTIRKSDLGMENITPKERYYMLNDALTRVRGEEHELKIKGADELHVKHDSVMMESCNTSFQIHFQVSQEDFARLYNIAQLVAAPVLGAAANSPFLFGKQLLHETRIAVFQQSIDNRKAQDFVNERKPRVQFGSRWIEESVMEIFQEDIARFRVLFAIDDIEDPFEALDSGRIPKLEALQLFNGTIYRWNRPCYGITDGKPHLRIENRVLPSGPSVVDEVANAAFWLGLMAGVSSQYDDITKLIPFKEVESNFLSTARRGLLSQIKWLDGNSYPTQDLIMNELIPLAREGLRLHDIDSEDTEHYLGVIQERTRKGQNGAIWQLDSFHNLDDIWSPYEKLTAIADSTLKNQKSGKPVHQWPKAKVHRKNRWEKAFAKVGQFMTTDIYTLQEDDIIDLAANVMEWQRIKHIPVENDQHFLVGMVTYRSMISTLNNIIAKQLDHTNVSVSDIMDREIVTVSPDTPSVEAIELMQNNDISSLPVVEGGKLVGIVTEFDFARIAAELLKDRLKKR
ncbi:CBS domain-containing protein [Natronogracilivirga saccharolytica]|uniref:CBS domain-containing protein n=1 Tax=Natronogracilivirga saccharolytica TaxID=2812953 RepID=A0A8J7UUF2_9BACT|nr:CBS domain-containing protein [Natronogracilivirga saccharolytica]MBP3191432.1 CBS domain-containing protein [Natronogracilivirga saccharolytica]